MGARQRGDGRRGVRSRGDRLRGGGGRLRHQLLVGRDDRATGVLKPMLGRRRECPLAAALFAISCPLRGESVEVTREGMRRGMAPADARGEGTAGAPGGEGSDNLM